MTVKVVMFYLPSKVTLHRLVSQDQLFSAEKRFQSLERKLQNQNNTDFRNLCTDFMNEYHSLGYMQRYHTFYESSPHYLFSLSKEFKLIAAPRIFVSVLMPVQRPVPIYPWMICYAYRAQASKQYLWHSLTLLPTKYCVLERCISKSKCSIDSLAWQQLAEDEGKHFPLRHWRPQASQPCGRLDRRGWQWSRCCRTARTAYPTTLLEWFWTQEVDF